MEIKIRYVFGHNDGRKDFVFKSIEQIEDIPLIKKTFNFRCIARNLFTGLQDVTGKDIYEGDIVLHDALPGAKNGLPIVFEDCKFIVKGKMESDNIVLGSHGRSMTVIGNIFET